MVGETIESAFLPHEEAIQDKPFPVRDLKSTVEGGTLAEVRALTRDYYRLQYGGDHVFVEALRNEDVNYYRIDASLAAQAVFGDSRPLLLFLLNFTDDGPDTPAHAWCSAREKFIDYYGCDLDAVAHAVSRGRLLLMVGPLHKYRGPFMREVLEALASLPEHARPVFAQVVEQAAAHEEPSQYRQNALDVLDRLARDQKLTDLQEPSYRMQRGGRSSRLPPVHPESYLRERLAWFDCTLPSPVWVVLEDLYQRLGQDPTRPRLDLLMKTSSVFQSLFQAPVLYSRGSSVRTCTQDLDHITHTLLEVKAGYDGRVQKVQRGTRFANSFTTAADAAGPLLEHLATRVPLVVEGVLEKANRVFERRVPRILDSRRMRYLLDAFERWLDRGEGVHEREAVKVRRKVQVAVTDPARKDLDAAVVGEQAQQLDELLHNVVGMPKYLGLAKSELCRSTIKAGGAIGAHLLPAAKPVFRVVDVTWKAVDTYRAVNVPRKVRQGMNPDLPFRIDHFETHGDRWGI